MNGLEASYLNDFEKIRQFIEQAKNEAASQVNETIISLYWNIGKFVSEKTQKEGWGRSTVKQLSQYISYRKNLVFGDIRRKISGE